MDGTPGHWRHDPGRRAADPADRAAFAAGQGRGRAEEVASGGQSETGKARSSHADRRRLHGAGDVIAGGDPAEEICAVYRLRWQIELAFKRMKSLLHVDQIPTRTSAGA